MSAPLSCLKPGISPMHMPNPREVPASAAGIHTEIRHSRTDLYSAAVNGVRGRKSRWLTYFYFLIYSSKEFAPHHRKAKVRRSVLRFHLLFPARHLDFVRAGPLGSFIQCFDLCFNIWDLRSCLLFLGQLLQFSWHIDAINFSHLVRADDTLVEIFHSDFEFIHAHEEV